MDKRRGKLSFFEIVRLLVKRIRLSTLIMLVITLASSSYAWFIYATKVSTGITAHIEAWSIKFTSEDNNITEQVQFKIDRVFPGMPDDTKEITVYNMGDKIANVSYKITSAKILGELYEVDEILTSEILENRLANDFPFKIVFTLQEGQIGPNSGFTNFNVKVSWAFESGQDELDTLWGNKAYVFASNNPGKSSIELNVLVSAIQQQE